MPLRLEINLSLAFAESYFQVAKHVTLTGYYFWPGVLMMGDAKFQSLSPEIQKVLIDAGHEVIVKHDAYARDQEAEISKKLEAAGVKILKLSDLDETCKRTQLVVDAWVSKDPLI
jgi:TRAP-type C4-dicarboxylate transport system substrate-binding protein